ncbi:MAG TPA: hypothetical protein VH008_23565, partial [Pseudonocardia sp.]|nr:hypothetical protein [Pseudonocardia sp.]
MAEPGFVERHRLHSDEQLAAAAQVLERAEREQLELVRVSFVDQHGLLRGKTVAAAELGSVLRGGVAVVSTLLSKDTSGQTVYSAFAPDGGVGIAEMAGAGDMVMVPDPGTFQVLEWAERTGWLLCDLHFRNGEPVPLCSRGVLRRAVARAADLGYAVQTGVELEFHLFRATGSPHSASQPDDGTPAGYELLNPGYQLLSEERMDALGPLIGEFAGQLRRLGVPLRTLEVEFGPS